MDEGWILAGGFGSGPEGVSDGLGGVNISSPGVLAPLVPRRRNICCFFLRSFLFPLFSFLLFPECPSVLIPSVPSLLRFSLFPGLTAGGSAQGS